MITRNLKVVIAAGGDGTRLGDLNPERKPKPLLFFNGRPLISYQLDLLAKYNLEILLSFTNKRQIEEFKKHVRNKLIPKCSYHFGLHNPFDHQRDLFRNKRVKEFIKGSDFLFTHGDLVVKGPLFEKIISAYREKECSIIIKEKARPDDRYQFILKDSFIVDIMQTNNPEWRYGGVYIVKNKDQENWLKMCESNPYSSLRFFELCIAENSLIYVLDVLQQDLVINVNTPFEFFMAQEYFSKKEKNLC